MKKHLVLFFVLPVLVSCNIYSPFAQRGSTEDLLEEGQKCLHNNDYPCAIEAYNAIPDALVKNEKLCKVYLTQGGMTLPFLINTVTKNSSKMLGELSQGLSPWTEGKSDSLDRAKTSCADYVTQATASGNAIALNQSTLLRSISLLVHCAIRVAKTDLYVATSESDTTCNTAGNRDGAITQADITTTTNGTIATTGMCGTDATMCTTDISTMSPAALTAAGLSDIANALNSIPAALRTSGSDAIVSRAAIRDAVN